MEANVTVSTTTHTILGFFVCALMQYVCGNSTALWYFISSGTLAQANELLHNMIPLRKAVIQYLMECMQDTSSKIIAFCCLMTFITETFTSYCAYLKIKALKAERDAANEKPSDITVKPMRSVKEALERLNMKIIKGQFQKAYKKFLDKQKREKYSPTNNFVVDGLALIFFVCSLGVVFLLLPNAQPTNILEILRLHPSISPFIPNVQMKVATVTLFVVFVYQSQIVRELWKCVHDKCSLRVSIQGNKQPPPCFKELVNLIIILLINMFLHGAFGCFTYQSVNGQDPEEIAETFIIHVMIFVFMINLICNIFPISVKSLLIVMFAMWLHVACFPVFYMQWVIIFQICFMIEYMTTRKHVRKLNFMLLFTPASRISGKFCWDITEKDAMKSLLSRSEVYAQMLELHKDIVDYFNWLVLILNFVCMVLIFYTEHRKKQAKTNVKQFCDKEDEESKSLQEILSNPQSHILKTCLENPQLVLSVMFSAWSCYELLVSAEKQTEIMKFVMGQSTTMTDIVWSFIKNESAMKFECTGFDTKT